MDATWFPVSLYEMRYERKWSDDDIRSLCRSGRLGVVRPKDTRHGAVVFFESIEDRFRYLGLRKLKWAAYERKERELARVAGIPYGGQSWAEVENPNPDYKPEQWILDEMEKVSHREYSTGFYFQHPDKDGNTDYKGGYINTWDVVAFVSEADGEVLTLSQRNKFNPGDTLEIVQPHTQPVLFSSETLFDENMNPIESANHAMMTVKIKTDRIFVPGSIVRKKSK